MKEMYKLSNEKIIKNMLNHFQNIVDDGAISPAETTQFLINLKEWILRQNNINSANYTINILTNKTVEENAYVETVGKNIFNVCIDHDWAVSTNPGHYAFTLLLGAHEFQHIVQSIKSPSMEIDADRESKQIKMWAQRYANRNNKKTMQKLIARMVSNNTYLHLSEQDADKQAYNYIKTLIGELKANTEDVELTKYLNGMLSSINSIENSEQKAEKIIKRETANDLILSKRLGVLEPGFNIQFN